MADTVILSNPLKDMMKAGKVALGMNVRLARSGDIARIAKSCGHDFIFIDGQHAIFTRETIAHIASTALGCGITPLARVRSVDDQDVQVLLDNGVDRKSTRLNSSHLVISYAVFCLKKKK